MGSTPLPHRPGRHRGRGAPAPATRPVCAMPGRLRAAPPKPRVERDVPPDVVSIDRSGSARAGRDRDSAAPAVAHPATQATDPSAARPCVSRSRSSPPVRLARPRTGTRPSGRVPGHRGRRGGPPSGLRRRLVGRERRPAERLPSPRGRDRDLDALDNLPGLDLARGIGGRGTRVRAGRRPDPYPAGAGGGADHVRSMAPGGVQLAALRQPAGRPLRPSTRQAAGRGKISPGRPGHTRTAPPTQTWHLGGST